MYYTVKLQSNTVTGLLFSRMPQRIPTDEQDSATERKFYLPAGAPPSFFGSRFERLWAALFEHQVGTSE